MATREYPKEYIWWLESGVPPKQPAAKALVEAVFASAMELALILAGLSVFFIGTPDDSRVANFEYMTMFSMVLAYTGTVGVTMFDRRSDASPPRSKWLFSRFLNSPLRPSVWMIVAIYWIPPPINPVIGWSVWAGLCLFELYFADNVTAMALRMCMFFPIVLSVVFLWLYQVMHLPRFAALPGLTDLAGFSGWDNVDPIWFFMWYLARMVTIFCWNWNAPWLERSIKQSISTMRRMRDARG
jgi:hypothetical protein